MKLVEGSFTLYRNDSESMTHADHDAFIDGVVEFIESRGWSISMSSRLVDDEPATLPGTSRLLERPEPGESEAE